MHWTARITPDGSRRQVHVPAGHLVGGQQVWGQARRAGPLHQHPELHQLDQGQPPSIRAAPKLLKLKTIFSSPNQLASRTAIDQPHISALKGQSYKMIMHQAVGGSNLSKT